MSEPKTSDRHGATEVLYTASGAARARASPWGSPAEPPSRDVSCRRDTSSTEPGGSASPPPTGSASSSSGVAGRRRRFPAAAFFPSPKPLSLEASDLLGRGLASRLRSGSWATLWRRRLCFMAKVLPQPACAQAKGRSSSWKEPTWLCRLNGVVKERSQPARGQRSTTRVSAWTRRCCRRNQASRNTLSHRSQRRASWCRSLRCFRYSVQVAPAKPQPSASHGLLGTAKRMPQPSWAHGPQPSNAHAYLFGSRACTRPTCRARLALVEKVCSQPASSQRNGRAPLCVSSCRVAWYALQNDLSQPSRVHAKGFAPAAAQPDTEQMYRFSGSGPGAILTVPSGSGSALRRFIYPRAVAGERKGTNKYYPPDFDPVKHGSLNGYHKTHALRERARKLSQGILIIRFEMPYNIWCDGCKNHIGMERAEKEKLETDAMFKLDHSGKDQEKLKRALPSLSELQDYQSAKKDDFQLNSALRRHFRVGRLPAPPDEAELSSTLQTEKKEQAEQEEQDNCVRTRTNLSIPLLPERDEDRRLAALLTYQAPDSYEDKKHSKRKEISSRSWFTSSSSSSSSPGGASGSLLLKLSMQGKEAAGSSGWLSVCSSVSPSQVVMVSDAPVGSSSWQLLTGSTRWRSMLERQVYLLKRIRKTQRPRGQLYTECDT
ncbi:Coiled-coil domain-containing protein 130 [Liparis tanakae]|uniref:Probable splicing factor YJU2B n=1 Tax=Liparis tanakae TaxID=230148 RepID=A0A4Z2F0D4_9TELE|nr:Coiled-coil domain-containing protein 130 [Liparis tanakae]